MKNILSLIGAGLVGGLIVVGATNIISKNVNVSPRNNNTRFTSETTTIAGGADLTTAAGTASPSVVYIQASESQASARRRAAEDPWSGFFGFNYGPQRGTGSGVIVSEDGYIVTNNHVIDFADDVKVNLPDGRKFSAKVVGTDPSVDLAVLKIDAKNLPYIQKGNSDELKIGEWVLAIGYPYDIGTTVTAGIVSATHKKIGVNENRNAIEDFIQTDAVVNPGNSGGALVNTRGALVGINTAIQSRTGSYEGYSFAIPVNMMTRVADDIIKNGKGARNTPQSNISSNTSRPRLGITMVADQYFKQIAEQKDLEVNSGVIVDEVEDGSSAQYAGILPNDVIMQINGKNIRSTQDIRGFVSSSKLGDILRMTVFRNGKTKEVQVTLK